MRRRPGTSATTISTTPTSKSLPARTCRSAGWATRSSPRTGSSQRGRTEDRGVGQGKESQNAIITQDLDARRHSSTSGIRSSRRYQRAPSHDALNVILGETLEHKRFFDKRSPAATICSAATGWPGHEGSSLPTRWIEPITSQGASSRARLARQQPRRPPRRHRVRRRSPLLNRANPTVSDVVETAPEGAGFAGQPPFLNAVVAGTTALNARSCSSGSLRIEREFGREDHRCRAPHARSRSDPARGRNDRRARSAGPASAVPHSWIRPRPGSTSGGGVSGSGHEADGGRLRLLAAGG